MLLSFERPPAESRLVVRSRRTLKTAQSSIQQRVTYENLLASAGGQGAPGGAPFLRMSHAAALSLGAAVGLTSLISWLSCKIEKDHRQDVKGTWWMPWHQESKKGVNGCDKPR
jgi:hypothetical protein